MLARFWRWFVGSDSRPAAPDTEAPRRGGLMTTHAGDSWPRGRVREPFVLPALPALKSLAPATISQGGSTVGMDANDIQDSIKPAYGIAIGGVPEAQVMWYASQGFIGYQLCAILAQHWLIDKACTMPAKDAIRKGYEITVNDGSTVNAEVLSFLKKQDKVFKLNKHMIDFIRKGRIFGIRIAMFVIDTPDPVTFYGSPFNIDGVMPGSYKGITQIDPYWVTPELTTMASLNPGSMNFYEPTFWRVSGLTIHRSHLIIFNTGGVADVLKPSYYFGGVSVTQKIYERVYAAERTANEAPMLAMTKRLTVLNTDLSEAIADQSKFDERMTWWTETRDNYGVKINGTEDELQQFDLTLNDLDNVIMTQYQLVAAIADVPGTKLLGTQPKGFNSTGEYEEASYHEFLETLQEEDINPLLNRHHELAIKSIVCPKFGIAPFAVVVNWNELDAMTSQEQAAVNLIKAQIAEVQIASGVIDAQEERSRIVADPDSGYSGITETLPPMPDTASDDPNDQITPPAAKTPMTHKEAGA